MSDETTQNTDVTVDNGETTDIDNKEPALVPSHRLKEEADKRRVAEQKLAEYEAQINESEQKITQVKLETELTYAREVFGEYVDDTAVQEYKTKYPDLSYKQIFGALGMEIPTNHVGHTTTPGRSAGSLSGAKGEATYTVSEIANLQAKDPVEYKRVMSDYASGKAKVVAG